MAGRLTGPSGLARTSDGRGANLNSMIRRFIFLLAIVVATLGVTARTASADDGKEIKLGTLAPKDSDIIPSCADASGERRMQYSRVLPKHASRDGGRPIVQSPIPARAAGIAVAIQSLSIFFPQWAHYAAALAAGAAGVAGALPDAGNKAQ